MTVTQHRVPLPATAVSLVDVLIFVILATALAVGFVAVAAAERRSTRLAVRR